MVWDSKAQQGNEAKKIRFEIVPYTRGKVLDLGSGPFRAWPHFTSMDNLSEFPKITWKPDILGDCKDLSIFATRSMDAVFSSHLLEHFEDTLAVLREWWRVIRPGGYLVLYLPHKLLYPNIGEPGTNPDHKHDFMPEDIVRHMESVGGGGWDLVRNEERNEADEYSFLQVYRKRNDKECTHPWKRPKPRKTAAVVRYGGIGDCLQAASVLPGLKKQGFHVVFHTIPEGYEYLKHDPHVDEWWIQDKEQVPRKDLRDFWDWLATKYDRFVNLSETVEVSLLAVHFTAIHRWPTTARHRCMNVNYMELTHDIAQVPHIYEPKFYPTDEEKQWAECEKKRMGGNVLVYVISGSSGHKIWPYMDGFIARIMVELPNWKVVVVGDALCQNLIEPPWREEPRVFLCSAVWSVRQTLAFTQVADAVVGPETGVQNAVSMTSIPKMLFLSHSSHENLTKHWVNTIALEPDRCPCYPCHQLHYNFDYCPRDEITGCALCQARISLDTAWEAFCKLILKRANGEKHIWRAPQPLITL